jgi:hypothetical protein
MRFLSSDILPTKSIQKVERVFCHCHLELEVTAVYMAAYANGSPEPTRNLWMASLATDCLGEWKFMCCVKKHL